MSASTLTATTIGYLFASTWAPRDDSNWAMHVPGAKVAGIDTAANLLNLAIWSLREQGLVAVEQLRPVETEKVVVMGGHSFARLRPLDAHRQLPGLEGALLAKAQETPDQGVRETVLALDLRDKAPWASVAGYCISEAQAAGLVEIKGKLIRKPVIADSAAVEALAPRDAEIVAARTRYREQEGELDKATIADCIAAVSWAHQS